MAVALQHSLARSSGMDSWLRFVLSTDHKHIGTMYLVFALLAGLVGGYLSILMRAELMQPGLQIFAASSSFNIFRTGHGLIAALYIIMPAMIGGFGNWFVATMIGAQEMAFPRLNAIAFWLLPVSLAIFVLSLFVEGAQTSLSGTNLVIAALLLAGVSIILSAINFITTIFNLRAPDMTLHKMPLFVWSILVTTILLLLAVPVIAGAVTLFLTDSTFSASLFDPAAGGGLVEDVLWFLGHPEIYALILPGFGLVSQIVSTFSKRPVFGYLGMVYALVTIGFVGFVMWAHHMFAAGPATDVRAYFVFATMVIAVPTAIQFFSWVATLWGGVVNIRTPMLWAAGFIFLLTVGDASVVLGNARLGDNAAAAAHFHSLVSVGAVFAILAGWYYWFPKITGLLYNETLAKQHFWLTFIGVNLSFLPLEFLGLGGDSAAAFAEWNSIASIGGYIIAAGVVVFILCMVEAFTRRRFAADNPWGSGATTLEWSSALSPLGVSFEGRPHVVDGRQAARIALSERADSL